MHRARHRTQTLNEWVKWAVRTESPGDTELDECSEDGAIVRLGHDSGELASRRVTVECWAAE